MDTIGKVCADLKQQGKRIVQCHGVFDLLHIGHIRHFEAARKYGDVLVVSVTPDEFVNKGPHRPAFTGAYRLEALAALEAVDYVVLNNSPTGVSAIHAIQPNVYIKGSDYKHAIDDRTGGIVKEREAVESHGGQLQFTDEVVFSSSTLINQHMSSLSEDSQSFLVDLKAKYSAFQIVKFVDDLKGLRVLIIGETIIDEYQYCTTIGKSGKEPTLAVKLESMEKFRGGVIAVANHVAAFCDAVSVVSFLGDTNPQEDFIRSGLRDNVDAHFLYRKNSPTIVKRRMVESYFFTKLLGIYEINDGALPEENDRELCDLLRRMIPKFDLVLVVDYGHSAISPNAIEVICRESKYLAVNCQSNAGNLGYHTISSYPRVNFACMTESEARQEARDRRGDIRQIIVEVAGRLRCDRMIVTQGSKGCLCYNKGQEPMRIPAFATQVVDRMGAGDTFLSLAAPCLARLVPMDVAGFIGNLAGAQAVATVGHRHALDHIGLIKHIESLLK